MKGLNNSSNNRRSSTCSFCRSPEHQVTQCPHVSEVWKSLCAGIIPVNSLKAKFHDPNVGNYMPWYAEGANWGDLYKITEKAHEKQLAFKERQRQKALYGNTSNRKKVQTCGYCGEDGHTRRTCGHLASDKAKLERANRNFRDWVYRELVERRGLSTGAIVKVDLRKNGGYREDALEKQVTTLVTDVNWDSINVFAAWTRPPSISNQASSHDIGYDRFVNIINFFQSSIVTKVAHKAIEDAGFTLGNGYYHHGSDYKQDGCGVPVPILGEIHSLQNFRTGDQLGWSAPVIKGFEVVSRAPQVLPSDWVDGFTDEMSVIFRKFSQNDLQAAGILSHLEEWAHKPTVELLEEKLNNNLSSVV